MKNKKNQQEIIVTVLLVLIAIAAVILISNYVMNIVKTNIAKSQSLSELDGLQIKELKLVTSPTGNVLFVTVFNSGQKLINFTKIVFRDGSNTQSATTNSPIPPSETRVFSFFTDYDINLVEIYPLVYSGSSEVVGLKTDYQTLDSTDVSQNQLVIYTRTLKPGSNYLTLPVLPIELNFNNIFNDLKDGTSIYFFDKLNQDWSSFTYIIEDGSSGFYGDDDFILTELYFNISEGIVLENSGSPSGDYTFSFEGYPVLKSNAFISGRSSLVGFPSCNNINYRASDLLFELARLDASCETIYSNVDSSQKFYWSTNIDFIPFGNLGYLKSNFIINNSQAYFISCNDNPKGFFFSPNC
jgi:hypothetical protein